MHLSRKRQTASGSATISTSLQTVCTIGAVDITQEDAHIIVRFDITSLTTASNREIGVEVWLDDAQIGQTMYTGTATTTSGITSSYFFELFADVLDQDPLSIRVAGLSNSTASISANLTIEFDSDKDVDVIQRTCGSASLNTTLTETQQSLFTMTANTAGTYRVVAAVNLNQISQQTTLKIQIGTGQVGRNSSLSTSSSANDYVLITVVDIVTLTASQTLTVYGNYDIIYADDLAKAIGYNYTFERLY